MKKIIKIEGMHCSHCSGRVASALEALGLCANVDLDSGVAFAEGTNMPEDAVLRDAVEALGFEVTNIK